MEKHPLPPDGGANQSPANNVNGCVVGAGNQDASATGASASAPPTGVQLQQPQASSAPSSAPAAGAPRAMTGRTPPTHTGGDPIIAAGRPDLPAKLGDAMTITGNDTKPPPSSDTASNLPAPAPIATEGKTLPPMRPTLSNNGASIDATKSTQQSLVPPVDPQLASRSSSEPVKGPGNTDKMDTSDNPPLPAGNGSTKPKPDSSTQPMDVEVNSTEPPVSKTSPATGANNSNMSKPQPQRSIGGSKPQGQPAVAGGKSSTKPPISPKPKPPAAKPNGNPPKPNLSKVPAKEDAPPSNQGVGHMHPAGRELKVEDALLYLDEVKNEFGERPRIYNEFLDIMKCFKAQEVDTIGVINRVKTLFRGYNKLILGFNTFLPEGYKIEMRDLGRGAGQEPVFIGPGLPGNNTTIPIGSAAQQQQQQQQQQPQLSTQGRFLAGKPPAAAAPQQGGRGAGRGRGVLQTSGRGRGGRSGLKPASGRGQQPPPPPAGRGAQPRQIQGGPNPLTPRQQQVQQDLAQGSAAAAAKTVEFDHAIMYVTNIKKRFASQPRTYHTFLEILHTYQKEQRGIKEVLEQVSSLFADHPDLLREFTFFLPDAVQEQAKERLSRAAAEAEAKQRRAAVEAAAKQQSAHQPMRGAPTGWRTGGKKPDAVGGSGTKFIDMTQPDQPLPDAKASPNRAPGKLPTDTYVYNAGVERQFFDNVKAALTSFSRDGQAYAEFIKSLDMYAQEILSRADMLGYVERLLGKHKDLFEEFKNIIHAVGSPDAPTHDDSWHSVPLTEIDFSRCRKCSPSYRALPRDYPDPPCSERSVAETKVLNDIWVSLPVGSEESYTFRHMRKNQFEETLFRLEDMRFEIDMCLDSNATTLQRLTMIYDELQFLSESEISASGSSSFIKSQRDGAGLGGKIYQYALDGRVLGIIHKHAIRRIYGDEGQEMLDLCYKNPAVAIPIVVNRLRQKDAEFREARSQLNRKWKDLTELNYYKSLDHRSITWRTTDKRATSTRTIVAEIKDRAANGGCEGDAALNARMEKAKEEHGTFYEVTMGCSDSFSGKQTDLSNLPKPTPTIFTPHMSFFYDGNSWAQKDAFHLISFALEKGSTNTVDKERCARLWRQFVGQWFGLSMAWMQDPATKFTASPEAIEEQFGESDNDEDDENDNDAVAGDSTTDGDQANPPAEAAPKADGRPSSAPAAEVYDKTNYFSTTNHMPLPNGTLVSTTQGEGQVIGYSHAEKTYEISLVGSIPSKTVTLSPIAIYCSLDPVESSSLTEQLRENDQETLDRHGDRFMIGSQCLYLFLRLHQVLIKRLNVAKDLAEEVSRDVELGRHIEKVTFDGDSEEGAKRYDAFLGLVYTLLDAGQGSADASEGGKYEDRVRHLLGNRSYELTTMDKLISHILKHLQTMANDDVLQSMIEVYRRHELAGKVKPSAFREEAALLSEGENMFAFQICNVPDSDQKICHCEFLGVIADEVEEADDDGEDENTDDNMKRGIDNLMTAEDADENTHASKRPKRG